jgi:hypothetical protein
VTGDWSSIDHSPLPSDEKLNRCPCKVYHEGQKIVETKVSHGGSKDISQRLLGHLLRDPIDLTPQEFERAVRGNLTAADERRILVERGILRGEG